MPFSSTVSGVFLPFLEGAAAGVVTDCFLPGLFDLALSDLGDLARGDLARGDLARGDVLSLSCAGSNDDCLLSEDKPFSPSPGISSGFLS